MSLPLKGQLAQPDHPQSLYFLSNSAHNYITHEGCHYLANSHLPRLKELNISTFVAKADSNQVGARGCRALFKMTTNVKVSIQLRSQSLI